VQSHFISMNGVQASEKVENLL